MAVAAGVEAAVSEMTAFAKYVAVVAAKTPPATTANKNR